MKNAPILGTCDVVVFVKHGNAVDGISLALKDELRLVDDFPLANRSVAPTTANWNLPVHAGNTRDDVLVAEKRFDVRHFVNVPTLQRMLAVSEQERDGPATRPAKNPRGDAITGDATRGRR